MNWEDIILDRPSYTTTNKKNLNQLRSRKHSQQHLTLKSSTTDRVNYDGDFTPVQIVKQHYKSKQSQHTFSSTNIRTSAILPDIKTDGDLLSGKKNKGLMGSAQNGYEEMETASSATRDYNSKQFKAVLQLKDLQSDKSSRTLIDKMKRIQQKPFSTVIHSPSMKLKQQVNNPMSDTKNSLKNQDLPLNKQIPNSTSLLNNQSNYSSQQQQMNQSYNNNSVLPKAMKTNYNYSNFNSTVSQNSLLSTLPLQQQSYTLDKDYDQSMIGPGSYNGANWSAFELISAQKDSKIHKNKPTYSFGMSQKSNNKQFVSKEQWKLENMLNNSPPVGSYDPNFDIGRKGISQDIRISENPNRFDDYSFKKKLENSPGIYHEIKDPREISFTDQYKTQTQTFSIGKRRGFPNQRNENDLVPSPDKYNLKSVFEVNQNVGYLIDRPREIFIAKNNSNPNSSMLKEISTLSNKVQDERNRGPGMYEVEKIGKGLLSQSQSVRTFKFLKSDRDYNHMRVGDKNLNLSPGQYFDEEANNQEWLKKGSGSIAMHKGGQEIYNKPKDFDIRKFDQRLQQERIKNKRSYI